MRRIRRKYDTFSCFYGEQSSVYSNIHYPFQYLHERIKRGTMFA